MDPAAAAESAALVAAGAVLAGVFGSSCFTVP